MRARMPCPYSVAAARCASPASHSILQHTSAYVSIRQHTSACGSALRLACHPQHTSAYVGTRQHPSAYVGIREHPSYLPRAARKYLSPAEPAAPHLHTPPAPPGTRLLRCQYVYFSTSKASKLSTWQSARAKRCCAISGCAACIRQHTSAYVSIRQHTSAVLRDKRMRCLHTSAYVSIRQHTSAYVSGVAR
jgi:hypothetical protein